MKISSSEYQQATAYLALHPAHIFTCSDSQLSDAVWSTVCSKLTAKRVGRIKALMSAQAWAAAISPMAARSLSLVPPQTHAQIMSGEVGVILNTDVHTEAYCHPRDMQLAKGEILFYGDTSSGDRHWASLIVG